MRSGRAEHFLIFQTKTTVQSSFGTLVETWADAFEWWGVFEMLGSREFPAAQKRFAESTARFRIRYRANIDSANYRIVMVLDRESSPITTSTWNIYPVVPARGKRFELLIEASEVK